MKPVARVTHASRKTVIARFCIFNSPWSLLHDLQQLLVTFLYTQPAHPVLLQDACGKKRKEKRPLFIIIPLSLCFWFFFRCLHRWCTCAYMQGHITTQAPTAISVLNELSEGAGPTSQALQYV